jgi:hypothetical protein
MRRDLLFMEREREMGIPGRQAGPGVSPLVFASGCFAKIAACRCSIGAAAVRVAFEGLDGFGGDLVWQWPGLGEQLGAQSIGC